jgi:hypothetical protein
MFYSSASPPPGPPPGLISDHPDGGGGFKVGLTIAAVVTGLAAFWSFWWFSPGEGGNGAWPGRPSPTDSPRPTHSPQPTPSATSQATDGGRAEPDGGLLPDILTVPELGQAVDMAKVLDGEFEATEFIGLLDSSTGVALGQTYPLAGYASDESGSADDPEAGQTKAVLATFDPATGQAKWQIDLMAAVEPYAPEDRYGWAEYGWSADLDGHGNVLAELYTGEDGPGALVTIAGDGQVVSGRDLDGFLMACWDGIAVVADMEWELMVAYRTDDLPASVWSAPYWYQTTPLIHRPSGAFWVPTEFGYVDAQTGAEVGFGRADLGADGGEAAFYVEYVLSPASAETVVIRISEFDLTISRVEPHSGGQYWSRQFGFDSGRLAAFAPGVMLVPLSDGIAALDLASGAELWSLPSGYVEGNWAPDGRTITSGSTVFMRRGDSAGGDLAGFNLTDGSEKFTIDCGQGCGLAGQSPSAGYVWHSNPATGRLTLQAVSAESGAELWQVGAELPEEPSSFRLETGAGLTWLQCRNHASGASLLNDVIWLLA